jgi:hypothetical protein
MNIEFKGHDGEYVIVKDVHGEIVVRDTYWYTTAFNPSDIPQLINALQQAYEHVKGCAIQQHKEKA